MNEIGEGNAWHLPMDRQRLEEACELYGDREGRAGYYDCAVEIADDHPLQASMIILAVWNIARFRFLKNENGKYEYRTMLESLRKVIEKGKSKLESLGKDFQTFDFELNGGLIKEMYRDLYKIKGVEQTGASKVMHLLNRNLFTMWDRDMRWEYGYHNRADENEYLHYLTRMKKKVKDIEWNRNDKTLPKAIDEYNFVHITLPRLEKQKSKRTHKIRES